MTSKEFVLWFKGFTEGVHEFNITPNKWDNLKDKLVTMIKDRKLTKKTDINYDSISGIILSIPILQYNNNKYNIA